MFIENTPNLTLKVIFETLRALGTLAGRTTLTMPSASTFRKK